MSKTLWMFPVILYYNYNTSLSTQLSLLKSWQGSGNCGWSCYWLMESSSYQLSVADVFEVNLEVYSTLTTLPYNLHSN